MGFLSNAWNAVKKGAGEVAAPVASAVEGGASLAASAGSALLGGLRPGGGHQTVQSLSETTSVVSQAIQQTTSSCTSAQWANNIINVSGNNDDVKGDVQSVTVTVNASCAAAALDQANFQNTVTQSAGQSSSDAEIALTQWLDNSKDSQTGTIASSVLNTFTQTAVSSCMASSTSNNVLNVSGSGDSLEGVTQSAMSNVAASCLLQVGQTAEALSTVTDALNQQATYTSANPLSFISDALNAIGKDVMVAVAVAFIVLICGFFLFMWMGKLPARPVAPAAAPSAAASSAAAQ